MNIQEQRRENFEAWAIGHFASPDLNRIDDQYTKQWMRDAWNGWNAALDSVEIDLVEWEKQESDMGKRSFEILISNIEAAGLKVKTK